MGQIFFLLFFQFQLEFVEFGNFGSGINLGIEFVDYMYKSDTAKQIQYVEE